MSDSPAPQANAEEGSDLFAERAPLPIEWLLLTGNRWLVAGALLGVFALALTVLFWTDTIAVANDDTLTRSLSALIGGNLTLVTIVISINQLVLSREFSSPAELKDRIHEMVEYRQAAAKTIESRISPATPDDFLDFLVTALREETVPLRDELDRLDDEDARATLRALTDSLLGQTETISDALEGSSRGPFGTLLVVLDARIAADLHDARWIQAMYRDSLSDAADDHLDDVVTILEDVGVARQYLKSLYFRRELAALSRKILSTGVLALGLLLVTTWVYGATPAPTVQGTALVALTGATAVVAFAPLAVFFAYVLRIATLTRRTASLVPFAIRERSSV